VCIKEKWSECRRGDTYPPIGHPWSVGSLVCWFVDWFVGSLVLVGLGLRLSLFDLSYSSEGKVSSPNWTDVCGRLYFADFIIAFCVFIKFFRKKKT
jgi:hypothetical protein